MNQDSPRESKLHRLKRANMILAHSPGQGAWRSSNGAQSSEKGKQGQARMRVIWIGKYWLFPVELASKVCPEAGRILNGAIVQLFILSPAVDASAGMVVYHDRTGGLLQKSVSLRNC